LATASARAVRCVHRHRCGLSLPLRQPVSVQVHRLRAVKNKVPAAQYCVLASLQSRCDARGRVVGSN
jgi:hypothetical protein